MSGLPIKLDKDVYLRLQDFGDNRDRHIINSATVVAFNTIDVRKVNCRDKNDRYMLEPRMLMNNLGKFEPVEFRQLNIYEGNVKVPNAAKIYGISSVMSNRDPTSLVSG